MKNSPTRPRWLAGLTASVLAVTGLGLTGMTGASAATPAPLTNLAHLDFLLDQATPPDQDGHTTYRLAEEPELTMPWTYADARAGGTFERVGGGPLDPATGDWGQGAYNSDDVSRAAVVYIRHWQQTGAESSRDHAYDLLRSLAYFQTTEGPNAGNVVLWMQTDGELNPSAEPVELPDPSDSAESYWLARTLWAFGEGYAAFADEDADFAAFLKERLGLARAAVDRQVLDTYGQYVIADGVKVPAWLIVDGADASAEAVLGLAAYVGAAPKDKAAKETLRKLAEGIAAMGAGNSASWPYGAVMPWAKSRSMWHAWGSQMPAALAEASAALGKTEYLKPAIADTAVFTATLLVASGPDNGWFPGPTDQTQIAYGADSRLQSLLTVGRVAKLPGLSELAAIQASWYFGSNRSGQPVYDPATGIVFDGVQPNGSVNRNSGAESTIHGLLSMLALDANPEVAKRAQSVASVSSRDGLKMVEAESATKTTGTITTPASAWTGESLYSGNVLNIARGQQATFTLGASSSARIVEPICWVTPAASSKTLWTTGVIPLGYLTHSVGAQGITDMAGALLPSKVQLALPEKKQSLTVTGVSGTTTIDALLVRPTVSRLVLTGSGGTTELVTVAGSIPRTTTVGAAGTTSTVRIYGADGKLTSEKKVTGTKTILVKAGGFAVVTR